MIPVNKEHYVQELLSLLPKVYEQEIGHIQEAARICSNCINNDGVIQVFGTGHSVGFGMELRNRVGNLVPVHQLDMSDFVIRKMVSLEEFKNPYSLFERKEGIAEQLYNLYDIHKQDVFIIISNSGINGVVVDLAILAKEKGHPIIVVTSWQHTSSEISRHPSGYKLYELADVIIDNCGPKGDAFLETGNGEEKIGSVSSITGALIAQVFTQECILLLEEPLPIWHEEISTYDKEHNETMYNKYKGRISGGLGNV